MNIKKILYITAGCVCLGLGAIGAVLPILPTVPFLLAAMACYMKSSEKFAAWFRETKLYKKCLQSYVNKEGMRIFTKLSILSSVTLLMGAGIFFMARKGIWISCVILGVVWLAHVIYFIFFVKTIR
ncbi:MAG: YbaN family protein [Lachnospiraceae bacterium]|nr:YbaN family protein [Lachnospiraceae bacterium]